MHNHLALVPPPPTLPLRHPWHILAPEVAPFKSPLVWDGLKDMNLGFWLNQNSDLLEEKKHVSRSKIDRIKAILRQRKSMRV